MNTKITTNRWFLPTVAAAALVGLTLLSAGRTHAEDAKDEKNSSEHVEIKFELPKPIFVGTPKKIPPGVNLQKAIEKDRDPLKAPADVTNVALEKTVTGSDDEPIIGDLEQITDGDKEATDGSFVVLSFDKQWVQIDLEKECEIYGVLMFHFHADPRIYRDVVVQVSNDKDFVKGVKTIFNNDDDNSSGLGVGKDQEFFDEYCGKLVRIKEEAGFVKGRYVRLYSNGSTADDQNHYIEVEVWGREAK